MDSLLDIIISQNTREDDLVHIAIHRILIQNLAGNLVDAHKHECQLSLGPFFLLFDDLFFSALALALDLKCLLSCECISCIFDMFIILRSGD